MTIFAFCRDMIQNYIDSYLAVAFALQTIKETAMTLESKKLTGKLHVCIQ